MFKIHKEGRNIIVIVSLILLFFNIAFFSIIILTISILILLFILRFFRDPNRIGKFKENTIYAPADGKVVVIEETEENEYFKDKRIQVSIFMSVWDVHINWIPVSGIIKYYRYHPGLYLVARHPKSSTKNERNTIVIQTSSNKEVLVRQIAGAVARRIVFYKKENDNVQQGEQMGFIKFGSRVDIFFPLGTEIKVKLNEKVNGLITEIARI